MLFVKCGQVSVGDKVWVREVIAQEFGTSVYGRDVAVSYKETWVLVDVVQVLKNCVEVKTNTRTFLVIFDELYSLREDSSASIFTEKDSTDTSFVPSVSTFNNDQMNSFLPSSVTSSPSKDTLSYELDELSKDDKTVGSVVTFAYSSKFMSLVRSYVFGITDMIVWLGERLKLHKTWSRLYWSPERNHMFPERFKRLVQTFVLDRNKNKTKETAMRLVFEHISKKTFLYEKQ